MSLVVLIYVDGMLISVDKFKTKERAIKYLESLGFENGEQRGRVIRFNSNDSYAEIVAEIVPKELHDIRKKLKKQNKRL